MSPRLPRLNFPADAPALRAYPPMVTLFAETERAFREVRKLAVTRVHAQIASDERHVIRVLNFRGDDGTYYTVHAPKLDLFSEQGRQALELSRLADEGEPQPVAA